MKDVFSWSSGATAIWWYPWKAFKKLILKYPQGSPTNWSIFGIEKGSFRQAQFKLVKSTLRVSTPFCQTPPRACHTWSNLSVTNLSPCRGRDPLPQPYSFDLLIPFWPKSSQFSKPRWGCRHAARTSPWGHHHQKQSTLYSALASSLASLQLQVLVVG